MTFSALSKRVRVNCLRTTLSCVVSLAGVDVCRNQFSGTLCAHLFDIGSVVVRQFTLTRLDKAEKVMSLNRNRY